MFQSTRPRGARPVIWLWITYLVLFQSTRPRGARRQDLDLSSQPPEVSIHAPAWGATQLRRHAAADLRVSIHAPAWGATPGPAGRG